MSRMVSPNELFEKACEMMLDGAKPITAEDEYKIVNFWAVNVHPDSAEAGCKLLAMIFGFSVTDEDIDEIVAYQLKRSQIDWAE